MIFQLQRVGLRFGIVATLLRRFKLRSVMTEQKKRKGPGSAPRPNLVFTQNDASSDSAAGSLAGAFGSCSFRSSLRATSA